MADLLHVPLVFIHGIKGGKLVDGSGKVHWLAASQALNPFARGSLELPLGYDSEGRQEKDGLVPGGVLDAVDMVVTSHVVYRPLLVACRELGRPFHEFSYDWRRDLHETVDVFEAFLDKVRGTSRVQVLAHSMGGLITFSLLNRRPDLFHSIVFAGVPFSPEANFLQDMTHGSAAGLNKSLLSANAHFTWTSTYTLFPLASQHQLLVVDGDGKSLDVDFMNPDDWVKHNMGIFNRDLTTNPPTDQELNHLERAIERAKRFRESLARPDLHPQYPPLAVLSGHGRLAMIIAVRKMDGPKVIYNFTSGRHADGDGRVSTTGSQTLPGNPPYKLYTTIDSHGSLLNNPDLVKTMLSDLGEEVLKRAGNVQ
eukprot:comp17205_c0_seq1/m.16142 comp17205_c0_seq1/g.16142  ORF comp17205_c0_seq1/g.16142 comp17205_c0_seq1/m.16142 type:complete len:367 (-) comp17205_c0_seq1:9-1109(-)